MQGQCNVGICGFGNCVYGPSDAVCSDGLFCNGTEICNTTTFLCGPGTPETCPPGQFCRERPGGFFCAECAVNADCSDLVFCNGIEICDNGECIAGTPPNCPGDECSPGFCDAQTDQCDQVSPPCNDNNLCTSDICVQGAGCNNPSNHPNGTCCNPATGQFVTIDDGNACTIDTCNVQTGQVTHTPAPCDDSNACTINDTCVGGGSCSGTSVNTLNCTKDSDCPAGICNSVTGKCKCTSCTTNAQCNDSITCTTDTCNTSAGFCVNTPNDGSCPATLFCAQQGCNRDVGCQAKDFCSQTAGNPCLTAADCNESTDLCGGCPAPTVTVGGSRYVHIAPATSGGSTNVALRVRGHCRDSQTSCAAADRFVDFDSPLNPTDPQVGRLLATSTFRNRSAWGTVKVRGTELFPGKKYWIYTQCDFGGGNLKYSAGVPVTLWRRSDNNNDAAANFIDVSREVQGFQGIFNAGLTRSMTDLRGAPADGKPDVAVTFVDISDAVDAFKGFAIPYSTPCP